MASLASIRDEYRVALQDLGSLLEEINAVPTTEVRDRAIAQAISHYTRRVPRIVTTLVTANSTGFYSIPSDWLTTSRFVSLEFPTDQSPPIYLPLGRIQLQRRETGLMYYINPNPSQSFRLTYTGKHGGGADSVDSIDALHEPMIGKWAVGLSALEFAARYANSKSNNLDAVNYRSKEQEWRAVAQAMREAVDRELRAYEQAQVRQTDGDAQPKGWRV